MKVFLTGGSGFVGQNLIPELLKNGYEVLALARSNSSLEAVERLGAEAIIGSLNDLKPIAKIITQCDMVIHMAAYMDFKFDYSNFYQTNFLATKDLYDIAKTSQQISKFVYISAASVVAGDNLSIVIDEEFFPKSPTKDYYSRTKHLAESYVRQNTAKNFSTIILRPSFIWGEGSSALDEIITYAKKGKFRFIGNGNNILSLTHIDNLVQAIILSIKSEIGNDLFFITDDMQIPFKEFINQQLGNMNIAPVRKYINRTLAIWLSDITEFLWHTFKIKSTPLITPGLIDLMGSNAILSNSKAKAKLGYKPIC